MGHSPPLWIAKIAKLHKKVSKIEACPLLQDGQQALGSKSPDSESEGRPFFSALIQRKIGRNLSEGLFFCFFFALHLILGEKSDEI